MHLKAGFSMAILFRHCSMKQSDSSKVFMTSYFLFSAIQRYPATPSIPPQPLHFLSDVDILGLLVNSKQSFVDLISPRQNILAYVSNSTLSRQRTPRKSLCTVLDPRLAGDLNFDFLKKLRISIKSRPPYSMIYLLVLDVIRISGRVLFFPLPGNLIVGINEVGEGSEIL